MARVALVTGGTRGIGAAIARRLKADGYEVAATYGGNEEAAKAFTDETGIKTYKWSVGDYEACKAGIADVEADLGPVDVLVQCRHHSRRAVSQDDAGAVAGGDRHQPHRCLQHDPVWPGMRERKFGRVVTISSINGQKGQFAQANYAASKAGDIGFSKALAQEGARAGITVNAVCPGYINTEMMSTIPEKVMNEVILPQIPVGRLGEADEIARCVAFLASDDAGFITGSTMSANGGQYLA